LDPAPWWAQGPSEAKSGGLMDMVEVGVYLGAHFRQRALFDQSVQGVNHPVAIHRRRVIQAVPRMKLGRNLQNRHVDKNESIHVIRYTGGTK